MEQNRENKLGTQPVPRLLASMAVPLIAANLITALYNVVDGIYVAKLSQAALTATTLAFPAQMIMHAMASGTACGVNSLLSRRLGARRFSEATAAAQHGLVLALMNYVVFLVLGLTLSAPFIGMFTDSDELLRMGATYTAICLAGSIGVFLTFTFNGLLQSTGHSGLCLIMQATGAAVNIILDPILIFGRYGFPQMGIAGAAVATVISQCLSAVLGFIFNYAYNKDVRLDLKGFRFNKLILADIYRVGVPSMLMQSIGSLMDIGMNKILISVSDAAVSVFGIYFKVHSFVFMPVVGTAQGMVPIVGYNYGAKRPDRMKQALKLGVIVAVCIMAMGTAFFQLFPETILSWFSATEEVYAIGIPALRITSMPFVLAASCIVLGDALTGMGIGYVSAINSFLRQILVLLPLAYVLERFCGLDYVWYAFVASEVCSLSYTIMMFTRIWKKKVKPLEINTDP